MRIINRISKILIEIFRKKKRSKIVVKLVKSATIKKALNKIISMLHLKLLKTFFINKFLSTKNFR